MRAGPPPKFEPKPKDPTGASDWVQLARWLAVGAGPSRRRTSSQAVEFIPKPRDAHDSSRGVTSLADLTVKGTDVKFVLRGSRKAIHAPRATHDHDADGVGYSRCHPAYRPVLSRARGDVRKRCHVLHVNTLAPSTYPQRARAKHATRLHGPRKLG